MKNKISFSAYLLTYGALIAAALIALFVLMTFLDFARSTELRFLNFFIMLGGLFLAMKKYLQSRGFRVNYLEGMLAGSIIGGFASFLFGMFVFIYLSYIDPDFMVFLQNEAMFGSYLTPVGGAFLVMMEGAASAAIITFGMLQFYKRPEGMAEDV
ncbi:MAG: DUF4199 family protein [Bacteroidia bacterium]